MISEKPLVGVRYCGGCNPRYDRVALVKRLQASLLELEFVPAEDGVPYAAALIANGCTARCTSVSGLAVPESRQVALSGDIDFFPAQEKLKQLIFSGKARRLTQEEVLALLPHRPPMLLIDTASRLIPGSEAVASFYVDPQRDLFQGHFPGHPVLPGVYTLEDMAQCADLLLLSAERYAGKTPLLAGSDKVSFRRPIAPGDTVELHASLLSERPEFGMAICKGRAFVGDTLCAEAEVTLALR